MADESGFQKDSVDALIRIAVALEGIDSKLEKVVQKRVHPGAQGLGVMSQHIVHGGMSQHIVHTGSRAIVTAWSVPLRRTEVPSVR